IEQETFPGAIVPARLKSSAIVFYAIAPNGPAWRQLQPLLLAFAGPTITDFDGLATELDRTQTLERRLNDAQFYAVARLRPAPGPGGSALAERALVRLRDMLTRAPDLTGTQPQPTSRLLSQLQDALNNHDMEEAWRQHGLLRDGLRLEAANLIQLE